MMMKTGVIWALCALAVLSTTQVQAQERQDGHFLFSANWHFGGNRPDTPMMLGLHWQQASMAELAPLELRWEWAAGHWRSLRFQGMPLFFKTNPRLNAEGEEGQSWGMNTALVIIAAGAAVGLMVQAAGDAASEQHPYSNGGEQDNPDCAVPGAPPATGECVGRFGS